MDRSVLEANLKQLPKPLVGSLAFDHKDIFRLRDSCVDMITEVVGLSKPRNILEIGTHLGHSSCLFLSLSEANVVSVDIGTHWVEWDYGYEDWNCPNQNGKGGQKEVVGTLQRLFPERFSFIRGDSTRPYAILTIGTMGPYDLAFIDGNHAFDYVERDIETACILNIPYILLDDYTNPGESTWKAAEMHKLILVKRYEHIHNTANIGCALFRNPLVTV